MTLDNLKFALILNNKMLLNRLKTFMHAHDNMTVLNGLGVDKDNHLLFKDKLVNEQYEITDAEIKAMVDEVIAALDQEGTDPTPTPDPPIIYGYKKTIATADPSARIEYIEGCQGFTPAHMDYEADTFNYGSWADAFFMKIRPVMLNYDGTVAYELDPNDYTKKKDGTASDVGNSDFAGNVMVGIPTIWFKRETIDGVTYVRISNQKVDETYKAYAHTNANGDIMKYTYISAYDGAIITGSDKLRSLSNRIPGRSGATGSVVQRAELNNLEGKNIWNVETYADVQMIYDLCILISKTNNSQAAFGFGVGQSDNTIVKNSGILNKNGLFYGANNDTTPVKVFGIENFWGNVGNTMVGIVINNGVMKIKMTYGTQDGSTGNGYNTDGTGYITMDPSTYMNTGVVNDGDFISETYTDQYGTRVKAHNGTQNTYECDNYWDAENDVISMGVHGGESGGGFRNGVGTMSMRCPLNGTALNLGASLSCKPDAEENILIKAN